MKTETVTLYIAFDGKEFRDRGECERYEWRAKLIEYLTDSEIYWRETCASDVVDELLKHYNITPK